MDYTATICEISPNEALVRLEQMPTRSVVLLLGGADTGKTSFIRRAVTAFLHNGRSVAVVDCDLGQSEIGPPGTVGVALVEALSTPSTALRDLPILATFFVGATSPSKHQLPLCVGALRMVEIARDRTTGVILVDTCGLATGPFGCTVKYNLVNMIRPDFVLAFARGAELDPILRQFRHLSAPEIARVSVSPDVVRKSSTHRQTRRAARFHHAFENARDLVFSFDDVALVGTSLDAGAPIAYHQLTFVSNALKCPALHAERLPDNRLYVVVNGELWDRGGLASVESYFKARDVQIVPAQRFAHLLVGLVDSDGLLLHIGTISRIDFVGRRITVLSAVRRPNAVAQVWFGALRLRPEGKELGEIRPGEV